jgi:hypothetical protein
MADEEPNPESGVQAADTQGGIVTPGKEIPATRPWTSEGLAPIRRGRRGVPASAQTGRSLDFFSRSSVGVVYGPLRVALAQRELVLCLPVADDHRALEVVALWDTGFSLEVDVLAFAERKGG